MRRIYFQMSQGQAQLGGLHAAGPAHPYGVAANSIEGFGDAGAIGCFGRIIGQA